jgi:hypothetical protein
MYYISHLSFAPPYDDRGQVIINMGGIDKGRGAYLANIVNRVDCLFARKMAS